VENESSGGQVFSFRWVPRRTDLRHLITHQMYSRGRNRRAVLQLAGIMVVALAVTWTTKYLLPDSASSLSTYVLILAGLAFLATILIVTQPWWFSRVAWRSQTLLRLPQEAAITDQGLELRAPNMQSRFSWAAFNRLTESDEAFFLELAAARRRRVVMLPKRSVPSDQTDTLREFLLLHIDQSASRRTGG
jgi:hypothetical protein